MLKKHPHNILTLLSLAFFLPFLGGVHLFDWDEINFAESAREMLITGNYRQVMVNFEPFWEKPPLFFWFQAICMKLFGVSEFSARLPNVIVGILSLNVIFRIGSRIKDVQTARWWVLLYLASITPHFYFHSGIIDPLFNLLIFTCLSVIYHTITASESKKWILAGILLGLAVLTKGPVAILVVGLVCFVYYVKNNFRFWFKLQHLLLFILLCIAVTSLWFLPEVIINGPGFLKNFIAYQLDLLRSPVASHGQPWFYHPIVLLIGCFPASIFALKVIGRASESHSYEAWMKYLFWTVLLLFSIVTTKIVHYSSLCYFPLTYLAALRLRDWEEKSTVKKWEIAVLVTVGSIVAILFAVLPFVGFNMSSILSKYGSQIHDEFTLQNLSIVNDWDTLHLILGVLMLPVVVATILGFVKNKRLWLQRGLFSLSVYLVIFMWQIVPRIERYTQNSVIEFYKSIEKEDCYIDVYKYKSYAHYFYAKVKPLSEEDALYQQKKTILNELGVESRIELDEEGRKSYSAKEMQWYLSGDVDKPVYLISQPRKAKEIQDTPGFELVQNTGGYYVFKRIPSN